MPKIRLKPNSAEFADESPAAPLVRGCDMPGCACEGQHKAPRDRGLADYYWFCLDHVQEYNKAWDFFSGMSSRQIDDHIVKSMLWDRPTRRFDNFGNLETHLRRKAAEYEKAPGAEEKNGGGAHRQSPFLRNTPEFEAMAVMGLEPPLTLSGIKARYKILVKKYHPDINPGDKDAEELLKSINMAYTILKLAYEKYETLAGKP